MPQPERPPAHSITLPNSPWASLTAISKSAIIQQSLYRSALAFYDKDAWKVSQRLTLYLGICCNHIGHWINGQDRGLATWKPMRHQADLASGKAYSPFSWRGIIPPFQKAGADAKPFGIPLASAWLRDGTTVVRGGLGTYRWNDQYNDYAGPL
jgi:hypothetical protein